MKKWTIYGRTSPNLFDVSAVSLDSSLDENGYVIVQYGSSVSDYIPISTTEGLWLSGDLQQGGTSLSRMICYTYYDENKVKISTGIVGWLYSGRVTYEFTPIPVTASYIRIQYTTALWNDIMMNAGSVALPYVAYGAVGERTENLFAGDYIDNCALTYGKYSQTPVPVADHGCVIYAPVIGGQIYTFFLSNRISSIGTNGIQSVFSIDKPAYDTSYMIDDKSTWINHTGVNSFTRTAPLSANWIAIQIQHLNYINSDVIIVEGSEVSQSYEPYGYKIPVTSGGVTTNIYLDHQLGDGESISMADTGIAIPTTNGENILSVDTAVRPSNVSIAASRIPKNTEAYFRYKYDVLRKRDY